MSSVDRDVVAQLMMAFSAATQGHPNTFKVDTSSPQGLGRLHVIVADELTFRLLTKGREILLKSFDPPTEN